MSAWKVHVDRYRRAHPGVSLKVALQEASKTYCKKACVKKNKLVKYRASNATHEEPREGWGSFAARKSWEWSLGQTQSQCMEDARQQFEKELRMYIGEPSVQQKRFCAFDTPKKFAIVIAAVVRALIVGLIVYATGFGAAAADIVNRLWNSWLVTGIQYVFEVVTGWCGPALNATDPINESLRSFSATSFFQRVRSWLPQMTGTVGAGLQAAASLASISPCAVLVGGVVFALETKTAAIVLQITRLIGKGVALTTKKLYTILNDFKILRPVYIAHLIRHPEATEGMPEDQRKLHEAFWSYNQWTSDAIHDFSKKWNHIVDSTHTYVTSTKDAPTKAKHHVLTASKHHVLTGQYKLQSVSTGKYVTMNWSDSYIVLGGRGTVVTFTVEKVSTRQNVYVFKNGNKAMNVEGAPKSTVPHSHRVILNRFTGRENDTDAFYWQITFDDEDDVVYLKNVRQQAYLNNDLTTFKYRGTKAPPASTQWKLVR